MPTLRPGRARRAPRRALLAVTAVAVALLLSGCAPERLGAAAVVDGEPIATQRVQDLAQEYVETVPGQEPGQVQLALLQQLVVDEIFQRISQDRGVRVPEGRVAAQLRTLVTQTGSRKALVRALAQQQNQVVAPSRLEDWLRGRLLFDAIARDLSETSGQPDSAAFDAANRELTEYAGRLDIEINPRYGSWNPDTGIAPLVGGGLSKTVAELGRGRS